VLFVVYGVHHGLTEGPERALVSRIVPKSRRGTGFGLYHLTIGMLGLVASVLFGVLWDQVSPEAAFLTGAGLALVAAVALRTTDVADARST
jgi:MFS family permease